MTHRRCNVSFFGFTTALPVSSRGSLLYVVIEGLTVRVRDTRL